MSNTSGEAGAPYFVGLQHVKSGWRLSRHRSTLGTTLADRGNTPADVQPTVFLKEMEMEKVIAVGDLTGDDLFFSLIIGNGEGNLHRFIGRVLLGKVDEFYVVACS
jgi:hypothetical protein